MDDRIDRLLDQWVTERPELNASSLDIVARIQELAKLLRRGEDEGLGELDLKMWEYDVLSALRRQGRPYALPASQLARETMLSSGAMTNRIDRLEQRQLVSRETDPNDRRGILVSLTRDGKSLIDQALEARLALADEQVAMLGNDERLTLANGLRKLSESIHE